MSRGSRISGSSLPGGEISGDRRGVSETRRRPATGLWQTGQTETYTDGQCHSPAHPSLRRVSASAHRGGVLEHGAWRADPGRGPLLAVRRQPKGMGVRSSATGNARGGSPDGHRSEVPLLSDVQRGGRPLQLLSSHAGPCLHGQPGRAPTVVGSHATGIASSAPPPLPHRSLSQHHPAWAVHSPRLPPDGLVHYQSLSQHLPARVAHSPQLLPWLFPA